MAADNNHASDEGVDQNGSSNGPKQVVGQRSPVRWTVGVIVRCVSTFHGPSIILRETYQIPCKGFS